MDLLKNVDLMDKMLHETDYEPWATAWNEWITLPICSKAPEFTIDTQAMPPPMSESNGSGKELLCSPVSETNFFSPSFLSSLEEGRTAVEEASEPIGIPIPSRRFSQTSTLTSPQGSFESDTSLRYVDNLIKNRIAASEKVEAMITNLPKLPDNAYKKVVTGDKTMYHCQYPGCDKCNHT
jgi:hypothetical protein